MADDDDSVVNPPKRLQDILTVEQQQALKIRSLTGLEHAAVDASYASNTPPVPRLPRGIFT